MIHHPSEVIGLGRPKVLVLNQTMGMAALKWIFGKYSTVFGDDYKETETRSNSKYTAVQKVEPSNPFDFL